MITKNSQMNQQHIKSMKYNKQMKTNKRNLNKPQKQMYIKLQN